MGIINKHDGYNQPNDKNNSKEGGTKIDKCSGSQKFINIANFVTNIYETCRISELTFDAMSKYNAKEQHNKHENPHVG